MPNPYFDVLNRPTKDGKPRKKKPTPSHLRAKKQEAEVGRRVGGFLVPASGAKDMKGDVRKRRVVRVECKTTKNKSFSVTLDMAQKIEEAALSGGEAPVLLIEFNDGTGKKIAELAVIPGYFLDEFCERQL